jgi:hypothetical protein
VRVVAFATTGQIRSALEPVHVLHLSGHRGPGHLVLENENGAARKIDADTFVNEAIPPGSMPPVIAVASVLHQCRAGIRRRRLRVGCWRVALRS